MLDTRITVVYSSHANFNSPCVLMLDFLFAYFTCHCKSWRRRHDVQLSEDIDTSAVGASSPLTSVLLQHHAGSTGWWERNFPVSKWMECFEHEMSAKRDSKTTNKDRRNKILWINSSATRCRDCWVKLTTCSLSLSLSLCARARARACVCVCVCVLSLLYSSFYLSLQRFSHPKFD